MRGHNNKTRYKPVRGARKRTNVWQRGGHQSPVWEARNKFQHFNNMSLQRYRNNYMLHRGAAMNPTQHYGSPKLYQPPQRSPSPLPGSEEYTQRNIQQASELIKRQLNIEGHNIEISECSSELRNNDNTNKSNNETNTCLYIKSISKSNSNQMSKKSKTPKSKNKAAEIIDVDEIHDKIIRHISKLSYSKKINLVNQGSAGYDIAMHQIQKQKKLELSRALRDMSNRTSEDISDCEVINAIIPDIGIKIEDLPREIIAQLSETLDLDFDHNSEFRYRRPHFENDSNDCVIVNQFSSNALVLSYKDNTKNETSFYHDDFNATNDFYSSQHCLQNSPHNFADLYHEGGSHNYEEIVSKNEGEVNFCLNDNCFPNTNNPPVENSTQCEKHCFPNTNNVPVENSMECEKPLQYPRLKIRTDLQNNFDSQPKLYGIHNTPILKDYNEGNVTDKGSNGSETSTQVLNNSYSQQIPPLLANVTTNMIQQIPPLLPNITTNTSQQIPSLLPNETTYTKSPNVSQDVIPPTCQLTVATHLHDAEMLPPLKWWPAQNSKSNGEVSGKSLQNETVNDIVSQKSAGKLFDTINETINSVLSCTDESAHLDRTNTIMYPHLQNETVNDIVSEKSSGKLFDKINETINSVLSCTDESSHLDKTNTTTYPRSDAISNPEAKKNIGNVNLSRLNGRKVNFGRQKPDAAFKNKKINQHKHVCNKKKKKHKQIFEMGYKKQETNILHDPFSFDPHIPKNMSILSNIIPQLSTISEDNLSFCDSSMTNAHNEVIPTEQPVPHLLSVSPIKKCDRRTRRCRSTEISYGSKSSVCGTRSRSVEIVKENKHSNTNNEIRLICANNLTNSININYNIICGKNNHINSDKTDANGMNGASEMRNEMCSNNIDPNFKKVQTLQNEIFLPRHEIDSNFKKCIEVQTEPVTIIKCFNKSADNSKSITYRKNIIKQMMEVDNEIEILTKFRQSLYQELCVEEESERISYYEPQKRKRAINDSPNKRKKLARSKNMHKKVNKRAQFCRSEKPPETPRPAYLLPIDSSVAIDKNDLVNTQESAVCDGSKECALRIDAVESPPTEVNFKDWAGSILVIKVIADDVVAGNDMGVLYFYNVNTESLKTNITLSQKPITSICVSKNVDDNIIYVGCLDGALYTLDYKERQVLNNVDVEDPIQCIELCWGFVFMGSQNGNLIRYTVKEQKVADNISISDSNVLMLRAIQEGARRVLLVATRNCPVTIRDAMSGLLMRNMEGILNPTVYAVLFHNNNIYCGTSQHDVLVYTFHEGLFSFKLGQGNTSGVVSMNIVKNLLFVGCYNGFIYVYNTITNEFLTSMEGPGGLFLSMDVTETKIVVGTKKSHFKVWSLPSVILKELNTIKS